jgi:hypothetical protein
MQGVLGVVIGVIVVAVGLAGLSVALEIMMTHSNPNGALIMMGGLGVLAASVFVMLGLIR